MGKICIKPFTKLEICDHGHIYTCCLSYNNFYEIANLFSENTKSIDDIWNSEKVCDLRKRILNSDYSLCNLNLCREITLEEKNEHHTINPPLPEVITLAYDKECNIQCIYCRDKKFKNDRKQNELYKEKFETVLIPLFQNAKLVTISGSGEAFYSKHSRELIKRISSTYPKIKFNINTNGLLFNQKNCEALGILDKLNDIYVSIHSLNKKTYKHIMKGANLDIVMKNMEWVSKLHAEKKIPKAIINCVLSSLNYTEMPEMIDYAEKLNVYLSFSIYLPWGANLDKHYEEYAIWEKNHPNFTDFIKVLKIAKNRNYARVILPPNFNQIITDYNL